MRDERVERRGERRREPVRQVRLHAREHDLPERVLHLRRALAAFAHDGLKPGDFLAVDLQSAVVRPALAERVEVGGVQRQAGEILELRGIREAADLEDERTLLERRDLPDPGDEPIAVGGHWNRREDRDFAAAGVQRPRDRSPARQLPTLGGADLDAGLEERKRVDGHRARGNRRPGTRRRRGSPSARAAT